uniref:Uncharacterized protein n=1 Tax=Arundo donax TaxID=35708 RepID=A0A0A9EDU1_ARUDO
MIATCAPLLGSARMKTGIGKANILNILVWIICNILILNLAHGYLVSMIWIWILLNCNCWIWILLNCNCWIWIWIGHQICSQTGVYYNCYT